MVNTAFYGFATFVLTFFTCVAPQLGGSRRAFVQKVFCLDDGSYLVGSDGTFGDLDPEVYDQLTEPCANVWWWPRDGLFTLETSAARVRLADTMDPVPEAERAAIFPLAVEAARRSIKSGNAPRWLRPGEAPRRVPSWGAIGVALLYVGCCVFAGALVDGCVVSAARGRRLDHLSRSRSQNVCPHCGYSLDGLNKPACPECGR